MQLVTHLHSSCKTFVQNVHKYTFSQKSMLTQCNDSFMYTHIHTHPYAQTHTDCISAQVRGWPCCSVSLGVPEMEALAFSWRSSLRQHTQLNSAVLETQAPKILLQLSAHFLCVCTAFQLFGVRGLCSCTPTNTPSPVPPPPPPCTHKHSARAYKIRRAAPKSGTKQNTSPRIQRKRE